MKNLTKLFQLVAIIISLGSCSGNSENEIVPEVNNNDSVTQVETTISNRSEDVEAIKFKELIDSGIGILVDVRTPEEYLEGHIDGAINIDFNGADFDTKIDSLDKLTPVLVYCQAGGRSGKAKDVMSEKGFSEVYNLIGGYSKYPYKD